MIDSDSLPGPHDEVLVFIRDVFSILSFSAQVLNHSESTLTIHIKNDHEHLNKLLAPHIGKSKQPQIEISWNNNLQVQAVRIISIKNTHFLFELKTD